jgi:MYXO-CTERM domain-containing protein
MKKRYLLLSGLMTFMLGSTAFNALAQSPYRVTYSNETYNPIVAGTTHTPVAYAFGYNAWDEGAAEIQLPFGFVWFGATYNRVWLFVNGFMSFGPPPANAGLLGPPNVVPLATDEVQNYISPFWTDLTGLGRGGFVEGTMSSVVSGTAPNRIFTIQATGLKRAQNPIFSDAGFQIIFEESSSAVSIHYGPNTGMSGATVGLEDATGTQGTNLMANPINCGSCLACNPRACGSRNFPVGTKIRMERPPEAELIGQVLGPRGVYPGDIFTATVTVNNIGQQPAGAFDTEIRLSTDTVIDANDTLLSSLAFPNGLDIATSSQAHVNVTMPTGLSPARYYLGIRVDVNSTVPEAEELNNTSYDARGIVTAPDLTVQISSPVDSGPGEILPVPVSVDTGGAVLSTGVGLQIYLSTDALLDPMDVEIFSSTVTLVGGTTYADVLSLQVPLSMMPSPPTYRLIAVVDGNAQVTEFNEGNNTSVAIQTITLTGSDLEVDNLLHGDFAFRGLSFPASIDIVNIGGATAHDFRVCAVISRNLLISVISDPILASTSTLSLLPGELATIRLEPVIDTMTSTGPWYFAMVADCEDRLAENLENNNVARSLSAIIIRDPAPDFEPIEMETSTSAAAGESLAVSAAIANYGNVTGAATVRFVVSQNPGVTLQDTQIFETSMPVQIAANQEVTVSTWATLPNDLESGVYYIGVIVDPLEQLEEVREDNNSISYGPLSIRGAELAIVNPDPANAVSQVPYTWRFAAVGGSAAYTWSVEWASGTAPEGLSFDSAIGELNGTPTVAAEGSHDFIVTVESGGVFAMAHYRLIVAPPTLPLTIVSSKLPPALANESYSVRLVGVGGTPPYRWMLTDDAVLPAGILLNEEGLVGGEPKDVGAYTFEVIVVDAANGFTQSLVALDVIDPAAGVTISTADIPSAVVGMNYLASFEVSGGTAPYTWRLLSDAVPGLRFVSGDPAQLVGTATIAGEYPIIVEVRDDSGLIDRNAYVLAIDELGDLIIETGEDGTALPDAFVGQAYIDEDMTPVQLRVVRRSGARAPSSLVWSIALGELPMGLSLGARSGVISGQPLVAGVQAFTVLAIDETGDADTATFAIQVLTPDAMGAPTNSDDGCGCTTTNTKTTGLGWGILLLLGLFFVRRPSGAGLALVMALLFFPQISQAQVNYQTVTVSTPYVPLVNPIQTSRPLEGAGVTTINLPFEVFLYGRASRQITINANGFITIRRIGSGYNQAPSISPSTTFPHGYVAGLWADWCSSRGGPCINPATAQTDTGVYYKIDTTLGDEKLTVEYRAVRHANDINAASSATFSIAMHASGQIDFNYGDIVIGESTPGVPTTVLGRMGIEDYFGRTGMFVGPCAGASACTGAQLSALSNSKISIFIDEGPDVAVTDVTTTERAYPGLVLPITTVFASRHANPLGPTQLDVVLVSQSQTSTIGGLLLARTATMSLSPFETVSLSFNPALPLNLLPGYYRVVVIGDSTDMVDEVNESNNTVWSATVIRVAGRAPDFRPHAATLSPLSAAPGDTLIINFSVQNEGNEPGNAEVTAYLSTNDAITTSDVVLGTTSLGQVNPGESRTATLTGVLATSVPSGRYYVGLIVDPTANVDELNEANNSLLLTNTVDVISNQLEITTVGLPAAVLTRTYSGRVQARGGNGIYTYRLISGTIPRGLVFNAENAEVYGIPLETGDFPLEFEVSSGSATARKIVSFSVVSPDIPLTIVTRSLPTGLAGTDYAVTPQVVGGMSPYQWSLMGTLPEGLYLATNGTVVGIPQSSSISQFGLEVTDSQLATATVAYTLEIRAPSNLTVVTSQLSEASVGVDYFYRMFASGGVSPYVWAVTGDLPIGLAMTATGELTGIPQRVGRFNFQVQVTDSVGAKDTNTLFLEIISQDRLTISTLALPLAVPDQDYSAIIKAAGGTPPYTWTIPDEVSRLPKGLTARNGIESLEGETAMDFVLSGRFEIEGAWAVTIRLEDSKGRMLERPFPVVSRIPVDPAANAGMVAESGGCRSLRVKHSRDPSSLVIAFLFALMLLGTRKRF